MHKTNFSEFQIITIHFTQSFTISKWQSWGSNPGLSAKGPPKSSPLFLLNVFIGTNNIKSSTLLGKRRLRQIIVRFKKKYTPDLELSMSTVNEINGPVNGVTLPAWEEMTSSCHVTISPRSLPGSQPGFPF